MMSEKVEEFDKDTRTNTRSENRKISNQPETSGKRNAPFDDDSVRPHVNKKIKLSVDPPEVTGKFLSTREELPPEEELGPFQDDKLKVEDDKLKNSKLKSLIDRENAINRELQLIKNDSHPELLKQLKKLEEEKQEKLYLLQQWKVYETDCITTSALAQQKQLEDEFSEAQSVIREKLKTQLQSEFKTLEEERNISLGNNQNDTQRTTRRRVLRHRPEHFDYSNTPEVKIHLNDREISEDLAVIQKGLMMRSK